MLIVHGIYHLARKRVACRTDFCAVCENVRRTERFRTLDLLHLFWIPVFPLGIFRRWRCTACGNDPRTRTRTPKGTKILAIVLVVCMLLMISLAKPSPGDLQAVWIMRGVLGTILLALGYSTWRHRPLPDAKAIRKSLPPFPGGPCLYCGGRLFQQPDWYCRRCEVWHY